MEVARARASAGTAWHATRRRSARDQRERGKSQPGYATGIDMPAVRRGATVATSVHRANRTAASGPGPAPPNEHDGARGRDVKPGAAGALLLQATWAGAPRLEWTVPVYLASTDPAQFRVGVAFLRRTFFVCVLCFGLTICFTA